jgi:hypothetical protein
MLAYLAWGTYRLKMAAWWGTLLLWIVGGANGVVMFSQTDLMEMYEKMGTPAAQSEMMAEVGLRRDGVLLGTLDGLGEWGPVAGLSAVCAPLLRPQW